jgi:hypothetical protein
MKKYKYIIPEVEAIRYSGANVQEIIDFTNCAAYKPGGKSDWMFIPDDKSPSDLLVTTGQWIIKQPTGNFYSVFDNEWFEKIFEPA